MSNINPIVFAEFTDRYGRRVLVNKSKVLALYQNGNVEDNYPLTFIELGPDGSQEATGPVVAHNIDEVRAILET